MLVDAGYSTGKADRREVSSNRKPAVLASQQSLQGVKMHPVSYHWADISWIRYPSQPLWAGTVVGAGGGQRGAGGAECQGRCASRGPGGGGACGGGQETAGGRSQGGRQGTRWYVSPSFTPAAYTNSIGLAAFRHMRFFKYKMCPVEPFCLGTKPCSSRWAGQGRAYKGMREYLVKEFILSWCKLPCR